MNWVVSTTATVAIVLVSATAASARDQATMIEWPFVASVQERTTYSEAAEISAANVGELNRRFRPAIPRNGGNLWPGAKESRVAELLHNGVQIELGSSKGGL